jgi:hypothetical protein
MGHNRYMDPRDNVLLSVISQPLYQAGNAVKHCLSSLRRNVDEGIQAKRRRSWERERNIQGGANVRRAVIAGISLSIPTA